MKINWAIRGLAIVFITVLIYIFIKDLYETVSTPDPKSESEVESAPYFELNDINDNIVSPKDYLGQPLIINFWASWCKPCRDEMPAIQSVYKEYQDEGLEVLAINIGENKATINRFLNDFQALDFTFLLENKTVRDDYNIINLPTTYFINPDGTIHYVYPGELSEEQLHVFINEMIN